MQTKIIKFVVLFTLIFIFLLSCVEEPTISPVKRAYSSIRISNFTSNYNELEYKIYTQIDEPDIQVNDVKTMIVNQNSISNYEDFYSGKRRVVITDPQTSAVIYDQLIDATSYTYLIWCFLGNSDNFSFKSLLEGTTYLGQGINIPSDSLQLIVHHVSEETAIDTVKNIKVFAKYEDPETMQVDNNQLIASILHGDQNVADTRSFTLPATQYHFSIVEVNQTDTLATLDSSLESGKIYSLFIAGEPTNMQLILDERNTSPARPK